MAPSIRTTTVFGYPLAEPTRAVHPRRSGGPVAAESVRVQTLPRRIAWSAPYTYDFDDPGHLLLAYQQIMTEGLDEDVLFYIDLDRLLEVWDDLWLSPYVRDAWAEWLQARNLIPTA